MTFEPVGKYRERGDHYAEITLDETWILREQPVLTRRELTRGFAMTHGSPGGTVIEAFTATDRLPPLAEQLLAFEVLESHRDKVLETTGRYQQEELSLRTVFTHIITAENEIFRSVIRIETTRAESILTTPAHLESDLLNLLELPEHVPSTVPAGIANLPTLWVAGSGGVLMHEAAGHPASVATPVSWPEWLRVRDEPGTELFETTIRGEVAEPVDLLDTHPRSLRRATFRNHPLQRLSNVVVSAPAAPFALPPEYIEIELTAGGAWDPLLDEVRVDVSRATLVDHDHRVPLPPFVFVSSRSQIAQALVGARGEVTRYHGVLCSDQGQWLPVGTFSPDLLVESIP